MLIAETLFLPTSLAGYQMTWLQERASKARLAALAFEAAGAPGASLAVERRLLDAVEAKRIEVRQGEAVGVALGPEVSSDAIARTIDLRTVTLGGSLRGALETLSAPKDRLLEIRAQAAPAAGEVVLVYAPEAALQSALLGYARRTVWSSLAIAAMAGAFVYAMLGASFVRPVAALTRQILRFRDRPQDASVAMQPSGRTDEIGRAEQALAEMEAQVRSALRQRERLAGLGAAVAKIAHDMRAALAPAQLVTERLAASEDPSVRQIAPRLERAIERAGALASAALKYGRAEEPAARLASMSVRAALDEAAAEALAGRAGVEWRNAAPPDLLALADADQVHRVFANLIRNAAQAIARAPGRDGAGVIAATGTPVSGRILVRLVDDGPGVPEAAKDRLFEPFSTTNSQGAGLGLAIARELARAQGGEVRLVSSGPQGATFEVELAASG